MLSQLVSMLAIVRGRWRRRRLARVAAPKVALPIVGRERRYWALVKEYAWRRSDVLSHDQLPWLLVTREVARAGRTMDEFWVDARRELQKLGAMR